jgi:hypothetical protein
VQIFFAAYGFARCDEFLPEAEQNFSTAGKLDRILLPKRAGAWFSEHFLAQNYVSGFR